MGYNDGITETCDEGNFRTASQSEPEIARELQALRVKIDILEGTVDRLALRLHPVLSPASPEVAAGSKAKDQHTSTEVGSIINDGRIILDSILDRVNDTLNRLEV